MTYSDIKNLIGKTATYNIGTLSFNVHVTDYRHVWNRDDVLISPMTGSGQQWVALTSIKVI